MKLSLFSLITLFSTVVCGCATGKFYDGNQCITKKKKGILVKETYGANLVWNAETKYVLYIQHRVRAVLLNVMVKIY